MMILLLLCHNAMCFGFLQAIESSGRRRNTKCTHALLAIFTCCSHGLLIARWTKEDYFMALGGLGSQGSRIESFGVDWRLYVLLVPLLPIIIYFACTTRTLCCCYSRMPCSLSATRAICCVVRALMLLLRFALSRERIALGDDYYLRNIRSAIDGKGLSLSSKRLCS